MRAYGMRAPDGFSWCRTLHEAKIEQLKHPTPSQCVIEVYRWRGGISQQPEEILHFYYFLMNRFIKKTIVEPNGKDKHLTKNVYNLTQKGETPCQ